jgi:hypothetical protein
MPQSFNEPRLTHPNILPQKPLGGGSCRLTATKVDPYIWECCPTTAASASISGSRAMYGKPAKHPNKKLLLLPLAQLFPGLSQFLQYKPFHITD